MKPEKYDKDEEYDKDYDIIIVGGGLAGATLAAMLAASGLRIALLEQHALNADAHPSYDDRSVALAYGSYLLLESVGLWSRLVPYVTPIKHIHISEVGQFGQTHIRASQEQVPALGYVIENRNLGKALYSFLAEFPNICPIYPVELLDMQVSESQVQVDCRNADSKINSLSARLLVAADGVKSSVRQSLNIPVEIKAYGQTAIICNVTPALAHNQVAYERFTSAGPLAFLPLSDYQGSDYQQPKSNSARCSVVYTVNSEDSAAVMQLADKEFLQRLESLFGLRLGRLLKVGQRSSYPLSLVRAQRCVDKRVALIGNAIHTLHPVAGQGFNLALRDAAALAERIMHQVRRGDDPGSETVLRHYSRLRERDHRDIIRVTDTLARLFTYDYFPLRTLRSVGFTLLECLPPIKSMLAAKTMGITQGLPNIRPEMVSLIHESHN